MALRYHGDADRFFAHDDTKDWNAFGLQPHRLETFKLSSDPLFVDKVRDIVGLYLSPPNSNLGVERRREELDTQIQALAREQPVLPMMPGIPEHRTHYYVRHGTTSLFAALDTASEFVIGKCYKRHRAAEYLDFLKQIDARVSPKSQMRAQAVDGYSTACLACEARSTRTKPSPIAPDLQRHGSLL